MKIQFAFYPLILLIVTSCIGIQAEVSVNRDKTCSVDLTMKLSNLVANFQDGDPSAAKLPFPANRPDLERRMSQVPGGTILSFEKTGGTGSSLVRMKLSFASVDSLVAFINSAQTWTTLAQAGSRRILSIKIPPVNFKSDEMLSGLLTDAFDDYEIAFSMNFAEPAVTATNGTLGRDRLSFSFTKPLKDFFVPGVEYIPEVQF